MHKRTCTFLEASEDCKNSHCGRMPQLSLPLCSDMDTCDCIVYQDSGPASGDILELGRYSVVKASFGQTSLNSCTVEVVVSHCSPKGPEYQCATSYTVITDEIRGVAEYKELTSLDLVFVTIPSLVNAL